MNLQEENMLLRETLQNIADEAFCEFVFATNSHSKKVLRNIQTMALKPFGVLQTISGNEAEK